MGACTEFCEGVRSLPLQNEAPPTYQAILDHLRFDDDDRAAGRELGRWSDLRERKECPVCQLIMTAILDSVGSEPDADEVIRICLFPGEQAFRISYPSFLGTRLAFVANEEDCASGPDNARAIYDGAIQSDRILRWLKVCDEEHDECRLGEVGEPEEVGHASPPRTLLNRS